jgi:hypothetical protein
MAERHHSLMPDIHLQDDRRLTLRKIGPPESTFIELNCLIHTLAPRGNAQLSGRSPIFRSLIVFA